MYKAVFVTISLNALLVVAIGCTEKMSKFSQGDCAIPILKGSEESILKIMGFEDGVYITFSTLLVGGRLILAEDYSRKSASNIDAGYAKIPCPSFEGTFSPSKYLEEKQEVRPAR